ncbi:MAG: hypothetical protein SFY80_09645 [Verrucomicrobiota bacterium]|nr:hypothetical protein [Verrucomicrobiota bacterium]
MNKLYALTATLFLQAALIPAALFAAVNGDIKVIGGTVTVGNASYAKGEIIDSATSKKIDNNGSTDAGLVFSNGIIVTLYPKSSISVDEFTQEAKPASSKFGKLKADPNKSTTKLKLNHGEMIGQTKNLRSDSNFEVANQVGVAGIRGSIIHANSFSFTNIRGNIVGRPNGGTFQSIPQGFTMSFGGAGAGAGPGLGQFTLGPANPGDITGYRNQAMETENDLENLDLGGNDDDNGGGNGDDDGTPKYHTDPTLNPSGSESQG